MAAWPKREASLRHEAWAAHVHASVEEPPATTAPMCEALPEAEDPGGLRFS